MGVCSKLGGREGALLEWILRMAGCGVPAIGGSVEGQDWNWALQNTHEFGERGYRPSLYPSGYSPPIWARSGPVSFKY